MIGGALPAALAADWLTSTWDQNAGLVVAGPSAAVVRGGRRRVAARAARAARAASLRRFVTGCQMAHVTALAAAATTCSRDAAGTSRATASPARPIRVLVGEERHVTVDRALRLLGIGTTQIEAVPADEQGRMRPDALGEALLGRAHGPTIVCAQAGNVNTGAFDPLDEIADAVEGTGAWLHVDGAFGLWAAASPRFRHLVAGAERADSWATDGHKWLNVPYDSGHRLLRPPATRTAPRWPCTPATSSRPTTTPGATRWTGARSSRAARAASPIYAAIRSLGRQGIAELVERCCDHARRFAELLGAAAGRRDPERRRPQPGARPLRRRRRASRRRSSDASRRTARAGSAGTDVAGTRRDADLGLELADIRGRDVER